MARQPTPKQILLAHIEEMHASLRRGGQPPKGATLVELARWHANQHHRFTPRNHFHAGPNFGAGERPPGWRTGEDAVAIAR